RKAMTPNPNQAPRFEVHLYNQSNDGLTAAIRAHKRVVQQLARACTGQDAGGTGRTLADYIRDANVATTPPQPFTRQVDILWRHPAIVVQPLYVQDRTFEVTYSGHVRKRGGFSFQGYCMVHRRWWPIFLPLHTRTIFIEYHAGTGRDLIVVVA